MKSAESFRCRNTDYCQVSCYNPPRIPHYVHVLTVEGRNNYKTALLEDWKGKNKNSIPIL